jgi:hypothetical protein
MSRILLGCHGLEGAQECATLIAQNRIMRSYAHSMSLLLP